MSSAQGQRIEANCKHLRYCVVGCFTTAESISVCRSLPQHDNQVKQWSKRLAVAEFVHLPRVRFILHLKVTLSQTDVLQNIQLGMRNSALSFFLGPSISFQTIQTNKSPLPLVYKPNLVL
jgi:hypothetical protein